MEANIEGQHFWQVISSFWRPEIKILIQVLLAAQTALEMMLVTLEVLKLEIVNEVTWSDSW